MAKQAALFPENYDDFFRNLKERIRSAQVKAALVVNQELVLLYWQIGREILQRQHKEGWGAKVIDRLARDLKLEFPEIAGLSPRNLNYMKSFAEAYPNEAILHQLSAEIPWKHNCIILDKGTTDLVYPEDR
jgi:predicted nuclease of restriction endonuclease-like (RecB) superfamily